MADRCELAREIARKEGHLTSFKKVEAPKQEPTPEPTKGGTFRKLDDALRGLPIPK